MGVLVVFGNEVLAGKGVEYLRFSFLGVQESVLRQNLLNCQNALNTTEMEVEQLRKDLEVEVTTDPR